MQWIETKNSLKKEFSFSDGLKAKAWFSECQKIGDKLGHHTDRLEINGNEVTVILISHDAGNRVTQKDWQLAQMLDSQFYGPWGAMRTHLITDPAANRVWTELFASQKKNLMGKVHPWFWVGLDNLCLSQDFIPSLELLNSKLLELAGFEMERTKIQYAGDKDWFGFLLKRRIMVTDYIRIEEDLDYTPLPDIFHDIFGHLPMLLNKEVADLAEKFGKTFLKADTDRQRFMVERLWWNSMEFGFMKIEGGNIIIGAGLISSFGECNHAFGDSVQLLEFKNELLPKLDRSPHNFHNTFMVFKSFEQISQALDWIALHPQG